MSGRWRTKNIGTKVIISTVLQVVLQSIPLVTGVLNIRCDNRGALTENMDVCDDCCNPEKHMA
jgi:hypothetical protein